MPSDDVLSVLRLSCRGSDFTESPSGVQSSKMLAVDAIELRGVCKDYPLTHGKSFRALEGVDLQIAEGEFVALVGPSGCGKTSILRHIAALEEPSAGSILVKGEAPRRLAESHRLGSRSRNMPSCLGSRCELISNSLTELLAAV